MHESVDSTAASKTPASWQSLYQAGRQFVLQGDLVAASDAFIRALNLKPDAAQIYHDLGVVRYQQKVYDKAVTCFQHAVRLDDTLADAWYNGGTILCLLKRPIEGLGWLQKALTLQPGHADIHYNIGKACQEIGRVGEARTHLHETIKLNPQHADAYNSLGTLFLKDGKIASADDCFLQAFALNPQLYKAAYNAAITRQKSGDLEAALQWVHRALEIQPDYGNAVALLVLMLKQACEWKKLPPVITKLEILTKAQLHAGQCPSEAPFLSFARSPDPRRNLSIAKQWSRRLASIVNQQRGQGTDKFHIGKRPGDNGRITVGYLSEQFRNAATSHLMASMFRRHDRKRFNIIAYSWGEDDGSEYRRKIESDVDQFVDIRSLSDEAAARQINEHRVDILVDLMGWMNGHRMGIAARRPAPLQVNYLGYPGTTGADFMDYIIADEIVIPPEQRSYYSEKVVSMPHTYQVTDPNPPCKAEVVQRSDHGLPDKGLVFCSFNTDYKIEELLFDCWMNLLNEVHGSVLWLITRSRITKDNLRNAARARGIDPQRLIFAPPLPKDRHLARLKLADLALDTLTVNGHTTTTDALWAGVPVITVCGHHFASRVAASLLKAIGLSELITPDLASYYRLALSLALNAELRVAVRTKLLSAIPTQPLFDLRRFVSDLERAYTIMWDRYIHDRPLASFNVTTKENN